MLRKASLVLSCLLFVAFIATLFLARASAQNLIESGQADEEAKSPIVRALLEILDNSGGDASDEERRGVRTMLKDSDPELSKSMGRTPLKLILEANRKKGVVSIYRSSKTPRRQQYVPKNGQPNLHRRPKKQMPATKNGSLDDLFPPTDDQPTTDRPNDSLDEPAEKQKDGSDPINDLFGPAPTEPDDKQPMPEPKNNDPFGDLFGGGI